jgi:hypothetical protein
MVVTHRDRLARMKAELVDATLAAHGRRLVVLDDGEVTDDLIRHGGGAHELCARLYRRRSARNRAGKAVCFAPSEMVAGRCHSRWGGSTVMSETYRYMSGHGGDDSQSRARSRVALQSGFADHEVDEVIEWLRSRGMAWEHICHMDPGELEHVLDRFC